MTVGKALVGWPPRYAGLPGQGPMRKFGAITWLRALPGLAESIKGEVPEEFWQEDCLDDGTRVGIIACPCGAEPQVPDNGTVSCPGEECDRHFFMLGDRVWVARYPSEELESAPAAE